MAQYHAKSLMKKTTGMRRYSHKKKKMEIGGDWVEVKLAPVRKEKRRTFGGSEKTRMFSGDFVNVSSPKDGTVKKAKITGVLEHQDNPHFVRRLAITKGCVVSTDMGKVRITSKPSQDGVLNGRILE